MYSSMASGEIEEVTALQGKEVYGTRAVRRQGQAVSFTKYKTQMLVNLEARVTQYHRAKERISW